METRYIGEVITVEFDRPPLFSKRPHCPDRFIWRGEAHAIVEVLGQRVDFGRRGRMSMNMQPEHAARAAIHGSWGVGRYFFTVRTAEGRVFELYYDRAPKGSDRPEGEWFLRYEVAPADHCPLPTAHCPLPTNCKPVYSARGRRVYTIDRGDVLSPQGH